MSAPVLIRSGPWPADTVQTRGKLCWLTSTRELTRQLYLRSFYSERPWGDGAIGMMLMASRHHSQKGPINVCTLWEVALTIMFGSWTKPNVSWLISVVSFKCFRGIQTLRPLFSFRTKDRFTRPNCHGCLVEIKSWILHKGWCTKVLKAYKWAVGLREQILS